MFALGNKDLQARYEEAYLNIDVELNGYLFYRNSKSLFGIRLDVPREAPQAALLAHSLVAFERDDFYGALLWLTSWDIGTPQIERCGLKILEQMRHGYGVMPSVENAPAQFFRTDEVVDAAAFL